MTTIPTVFLQGTNWMLSERTAIGFQHTKLGTITGLPSKADAIDRALEIIGRRAA